MEKTDCILCRIVTGKIPSDIIYQDEEVIAFRDINPQAPVHLLVIPKKHIAYLTDLTEEDTSLMGHMVKVANQHNRSPQCQRAIALFIFLEDYPIDGRFDQGQ